MKIRIKALYERKAKKVIQCNAPVYNDLYVSHIEENGKVHYLTPSKVNPTTVSAGKFKKMVSHDVSSELKEGQEWRIAKAKGA